MKIPYIGITDFMTFEQVLHMRRVLKSNIKSGQQRRLHVGVMMSRKTLNGLETKWTDAFPPKETIEHIFSRDDVMNCLHYADYKSVDVWQNLLMAISWGGVGINALQLDMVWPDPGQIERAVVSSQKHLEVILQVGQDAIDQAHNNPQEVVQRLRDYRGIIEYVLLDKSMGRGVGMDARGLIPFVHAIKEALPTISIAVAGGLGPNSVKLVEPLIEQFPDISIDAQSKLRPSGDALDPIDWSMAEEYLIKALELLP